VSSSSSGKTFLQAIEDAKRKKDVPKEESETPAAPPAVPPAQPATPRNPLSDRLAQLRQKLGQPTVAAAPDTSADAPDPGDFELSDSEKELDRVIGNLDIVDIYNRWSGKTQVKAGNRKESIKCSCPNPAHPDKNPSAWMNREKRTGYCSGCNEGFDLWDIAAYRFGYPVPGYKTDKKLFRQLRDSIATDLGYAKYVTAGKVSYSKQADATPTTAPTPDPNPTDASTNEQSGDDQTSNVVALHIVPDPDPGDTGPPIKISALDWRPLVPEGTFLDAWMREATKDTCPEEFHFFTGLMAVGAAVGRNRTLQDIPEVVPNLYVCLVGKSGTGKSRAKRHLREVLHLALPWDENIPFPTGTKTMSPGSGENLIKEFQHEEGDPYNPQAPKKPWPVRGYVEFDEMATLIAKGQRVGSSLKTALMELYDAPRVLANSTNTGGRVVADRPFGLVITTTQNRSIRGVLTAGDDAAGFVNRWAFIVGPPKPPVSINTQQLDFDEAVTKLKSIHVWASNHVALTFTPTAFTLFDNFILHKVIPAKDKAEDNSDIFNRMDLLLKKVLVLLACNEKKNVIDDDVVRRMMLMYPYLCEVYGVVDMHMAESIAGEMAEIIHKAILAFYNRNHRFPTAREIAQRLPAGKRDIEKLNKTLKLMCELGVISKEEIQGKRGPATVRFGVAV
jgi:hypothetical protein